VSEFFEVLSVSTADTFSFFCCLSPGFAEAVSVIVAIMQQAMAVMNIAFIYFFIFLIFMY
jgi:hypothetical protein